MAERDRAHGYSIKRQLQLLLPEVRVFLDVDDLADIGLLEEYVEQSATTMMFLSMGCKSCRSICRP
eukprot:2042566-Prymnesium_polylepis.1